MAAEEGHVEVVGMLLRARKHRLLFFEGETLFWPQDKNRPILLLMPASRAHEALAANGLRSGAVATAGARVGGDPDGMGA